jgi:ABC-type bacteriocin/lantibiotic exporter with double-glycine peptidase domain
MSMTARAQSAALAGATRSASATDAYSAQSIAEPHIRLDDVTMQYGAAAQAVLALQATHLEIVRGEFVALVQVAAASRPY